MRPAVLFACIAALVACSEATPTGGVRQVGGTTFVDDSEGATLVIDAEGCQSIMPSGSRIAEPVTDMSGAQVCLPPG